MNKPLLRSALIASTLAAVLLPASAAGAATLSIEDATGDTWQMDASTTTPTAAGSQVNVDIVKTTVKHGGSKVTITTKFADLEKSTNRYALSVRLRTNEGFKREVAVETFSRSTWGGAHHLSKPDGAEVRCSGLAHEIDYATNKVTVVVPRSCLSKPRWVQASVYSFGADAGMAQDSPVYYDNGHSKGYKQPGFSDKIRRG